MALNFADITDISIWGKDVVMIQETNKLKRVLWAKNPSYIPLTYLYFNNASSSVGYVNTHLKHKDGYKYTCKVRHKSQLYTYCSLYGVRNNTNTLHVGFTSSYIYFNYNATGSSISHAFLNQTVMIEHEATRFDAYPEDDKGYKSTYSKGTATNDLEIWIGCINQNNAVLEPFNGYVYGWKVENGSTVVMDLIPAKLIRPISGEESADGNPHNMNEVGFWDTVGEKFYPVSGVTSKVTGVVLPKMYEQIKGVTLKASADGGIHFNTRYPWEVESSYTWSGIWNGVYGGTNVFFGSKYNGSGTDGIQLRSDANNMYASVNENAITFAGNHAGESIYAQFYWSYGGARYYAIRIGEEYKSGSFSGSFTANNYPVYLNAINYNGTTRDCTNTSIFAFSIRGVKYTGISDLKQFTLRNFIPAKATMTIPSEWVSTKTSVSAGTLGLWDAIFGIFYPAIGSGTITEYTPLPPIQELNKLYTTSSDAVFNLECEPDGGSRWDVKYTFKSGVSAWDIGASNLYATLTSSGLFCKFCNGTKSSSNMFKKTETVDVANTIYIDQKTGTAGISTTTFTNLKDDAFVPAGIPLCVGGRNTAGGIVDKHPYEFYYSKLTDKDGNVVSNIVPVKLNEPLTQDGTTYPIGTIGLYDKVTERFLPKIGSGEVIGVQ